MLFIGTKKYPSESHFSFLLSEHGGSSNAYTGSGKIKITKLKKAKKLKIFNQKRIQIIILILQMNILKKD